MILPPELNHWHPVLLSRKLGKPHRGQAGLPVLDNDVAAEAE
jgi:hypothetical protein